MNVRKIINFIIIITVLSIPFCVKAKNVVYTNEETKYEIVIEDDANLLTEDEENSLKDKMIPLTNFGNAIFKSIESNSSSADKYARDFYYKLYGNNNGSLLLIDMDNRDIIIASGGSNSKVITRAKANIITDNTYKYASRAEYYNCAAKTFEQIDTLLNKGKIAEPMRYISNIVIAIIVSFFVNLFLVLSKSSTKKANNKDIISGVNIDFKIGTIEGTKTGTHTVYNPPSSSSGGSSGGGGGGGGFSGSSGGHHF